LICIVSVGSGLARNGSFAGLEADHSVKTSSDQSSVATGPKMICRDSCIAMSKDEQRIVDNQQCELDNPVIPMIPTSSYPMPRANERLIVCASCENSLSWTRSYRWSEEYKHHQRSHPMHELDCKCPVLEGSCLHCPHERSGG